MQSADPRSIDAPPRERALIGLGALLTEAPWTVDAEDMERMRALGFTDEAIVQAVVIAAMFNCFTRVADATGMEFDYESPLPRIEVDRARAPLPRPEPGSWPRRAPIPGLSLALRPASKAALARWGEYVFTRDAPLSRRDRAVLARTSAFHVCDAVGVERWPGAEPRGQREEALAAYAAKLTLTPWRMEEADLLPLRREGLDDRGLLDVIGVIAHENVAARVRLALGEPL